MTRRRRAAHAQHAQHAQRAQRAQKKTPTPNTHTNSAPKQTPHTTPARARARPQRAHNALAPHTPFPAHTHTHPPTTRAHTHTHRTRTPVEEDARVCGLQVDAEAARARREHVDKVLAARLVELLHVDHALDAVGAAVEAAVAHAFFVQVLLQDVEHDRELAEQHDAVAARVELVEQAVEHDHLAFCFFKREEGGGGGECEGGVVGCVREGVSVGGVCCWGGGSSCWGE